MPLIKFCKPEHNIFRGAKLQVGTLFGFRDIENPELQDGDEGVCEFTINFPDEISLDRRWANLLLQGAFGFGKADDVPRLPGTFSAKVENMHVVRSAEDYVVVKDTTIKLRRSINNCLVFCMSLIETAERNPFKQYDDHWALPEQSATEFSRRLAGLIFQQAKLSLFDSSIAESHSAATVSGLSLGVRHGKVLYRERHMRITEQTRPTYEQLLETLTDIPFVKPDRFREENEYRFIFELNDGKVAFPVKKKNLLLTLHPFADL